jgi:hypothetical protein
MTSRALLPVVVIVAMLGVASGWAEQNEEVLESNDEGEITLSRATRVRELMLPPGTYLLKSKVSGGRHLIRFMQVKKVEKFMARRVYTGWYTETEEHKAGEVACRLEPLGATVQSTTMTIAGEDDTARVTQVMIKGESHVHICQE